MDQGHKSVCNDTLLKGLSLMHFNNDCKDIQWMNDLSDVDSFVLKDTLYPASFTLNSERVVAEKVCPIQTILQSIW